MIALPQPSPVRLTLALRVPRVCHQFSLGLYLLQLARRSSICRQLDLHLRYTEREPPLPVHDHVRTMRTVDTHVICQLHSR